MMDGEEKKFNVISKMVFEVIEHKFVINYQNSDFEYFFTQIWSLGCKTSFGAQQWIYKKVTSMLFQISFIFASKMVFET